MKIFSKISEISDKADNFSKYFHILGNNRFHIIVFRLEPEVSLFLVKGFDRSVFSVYQSDDNISTFVCSTIIISPS